MIDNDLILEMEELLEDQRHRYCVALSWDPDNEKLIAAYEGFERLKVEVVALIRGM